MDTATAAILRQRPKTGLVLSGGGARAAYQVGVLAEIARLLGHDRRDRRSPYQIVCGTSAGAINAAAIACSSDAHRAAIANLEEVWGNFTVEQVYKSDILDMVGSGARWLSLLSVGWLMARRKLRPKSLLNNDPLRTLLQEKIALHRLPDLLSRNALEALAISASSYSTGEHVTFYQSRQPIAPWVRNQRVAQPQAISHEHLMASAAIPFIFPPSALKEARGLAYFGDGSIRQTSPISPAIHLGADRLLVVGAAHPKEVHAREQLPSQQYPTLATIAGHSLSSIFLDSLAMDVERMARVNQTVRLIPAEHRRSTALRHVDLLVICPSKSIDDLAAEHVDSLPISVKSLMRTLGGGRHKAPTGPTQGQALLSYLLFEAPFTRALIELGKADARYRADEVLQFFGKDGLRGDTT